MKKRNGFQWEGVTEGSLSCWNEVSPHFLGVTSFDLSIPRPYKVLRNAAATARMTGGFVFVTWRHRETGETLTLKAERDSWEMA